MAECHPGAIAWVQHWLYDCLYTGRDVVGFSCGMASIGCWIVAQIPQLVQNYRTKKAEALSPWFLAQWLLGDTTNLIGCLLSGEQLPTTTYTAMWFIFADICLMVQYIYYGSLQRRYQRQQSKHWAERRQHSLSYNASRSEDVSAASRLESAATQGSAKQSKAIKVPGTRHQPVSNRTSWASNSAPTRMLSCCALLFMVRQSGLLSSLNVEMSGSLQGLPRRMLFEASTPAVLGKSHNPQWARTAGTYVGYMSSCLYLSSRASQIHKNWQRKNVEGLAYAMFICSISANCLYGFAILIRTYDAKQLWNSLPWLIGSLGTVSLDITILSQVCFYGHAKPAQDQEADALLQDAGRSPRETA